MAKPVSVPPVTESRIGGCRLPPASLSSAFFLCSFSQQAFPKPLPEETCSKTDVEEQDLTARDHSSQGNGQNKPKTEDGLPAGPLVETVLGTPQEDSTLEDHDDDFPEGGARAWLVVFGSFCALFMVFGIVNSTAVFQEYLVSNQLRDYSSAQTGWIFSLNLFFVFFCGLYSGRIFDARGPRFLVALGSLALVLSMIGLSFCTAYWQFMLAYAVLGGVGGALLMTPAFAAVGHFFKRRRGLATGLANTSGSIGGVVIPLMLRSLLPKIGFAWSVRALGLLLLVLAVPANLFIRSRLRPVKQSLGIFPDLTALKDTRFALCAAGMFLMEWGLFVPLTYISSYATSHGQDASFSFTIVALLNAGSFFGRWIPGLLADRWGRFNVIILTILLCAITVFGLWLPAGNSTALLIVFAVAFGFASGSNLGLIPVCLSQLCPVSEYGRYFSTSYFITSFGIPIAGQILIANNGEYWGLIAFAGLSYVAAMLLYTASRIVAVDTTPSTNKLSFSRETGESKDESKVRPSTEENSTTNEDITSLPEVLQYRITSGQEFCIMQNAFIVQQRSVDVSQDGGHFATFKIVLMQAPYLNQVSSDGTIGVNNVIDWTRNRGIDDCTRTSKPNTYDITMVLLHSGASGMSAASAAECDEMVLISCRTPATRFSGICPYYRVVVAKDQRGEVRVIWAPLIIAKNQKRENEAIISSFAVALDIHYLDSRYMDLYIVDHGKARADRRNASTCEARCAINGRSASTGPLDACTNTDPTTCRIDCYSRALGHFVNIPRRIARSENLNNETDNEQIDTAASEAQQTRTRIRVASLYWMGLALLGAGVFVCGIAYVFIKCNGCGQEDDDRNDGDMFGKGGVFYSYSDYLLPLFLDTPRRFFISGIEATLLLMLKSHSRPTTPRSPGWSTPGAQSEAYYTADEDFSITDDSESLGFAKPLTFGPQSTTADEGGHYTPDPWCEELMGSSQSTPKAEDSAPVGDESSERESDISVEAVSRTPSPRDTSPEMQTRASSKPTASVALSPARPSPAPASSVKRARATRRTPQATVEYPDLAPLEPGQGEDSSKEDQEPGQYVAQQPDLATVTRKSTPKAAVTNGNTASASSSPLASRRTAAPSTSPETKRSPPIPVVVIPSTVPVLTGSLRGRGLLKEANALDALQVQAEKDPGSATLLEALLAGTKLTERMERDWQRYVADVAIVKADDKDTGERTLTTKEQRQKRKRAAQETGDEDGVSAVEKPMKQLKVHDSRDSSEANQVENAEAELPSASVKTTIGATIEEKKLKKKEKNKRRHPHPPKSEKADRPTRVLVDVGDTCVVLKRRKHKGKRGLGKRKKAVLERRKLRLLEEQGAAILTQ
ncbi:hypothetical protein FH972_021013 [Carpinus fangiana]|uniref:Major facilitator superfamily (MFS) profile domain-containing protein n=1 Tax=Carpinus fangiana TaxID=176857 RepID=A0A5N6KNG9_9ROSI|nr:hypothetical protein FH972_021013 [Carpinus fangiana]